MNQKILDEEKENFIHSNYHEKNIIERHSYFLKFKDALQQGNRIAALEYFEK